MWAVCWGLFFVGFAAAQGEEDAANVSAAQLETFFHKADRDADGKVAIPELHAFAKEMRIARAHSFAKEDLTTEQYDHDKDGKVSLDEAIRNAEDMGGTEDEHAKTAAKLKFKAADKDGNGFLEEGELARFIFPGADEAVEEAAAIAELARRDVDRDNKLSIVELWEAEETDLEDDAKKEFEKLDADHDGKLDVHELKAWESGRYHEEDIMVQLVDHADADKDGYVTLKELLDEREQLLAHHAGFFLEGWARQLEL